MVEYVYARHDFVPEHGDEISFSAGERIEVLEKDEVFNDGWWQVSIAFFRLFCADRISVAPSSLPLLHQLVLIAFLRHPACWDLRLFRLSSLFRSHQCRRDFGSRGDERRSYP